MPSRPDIDAVCEHIASYTRRDPWPSFRRAHLDTFLGAIPEAYGLEAGQVLEEVGRLGHFASLFGFLDESFLSGAHGPERINPIDDYLRRRGWQETPRAREYLQGIRSTPPTLFEVQDVAFGEWVEVRDRLTGGPVQRVGEQSASQTLQRWDCFVARVVMPRGERMFTGGLLSLSRETAARIEAANADAATGSPPDLLCFQLWLRALLDAARRPPPELHNTDGDPLLFARTRLPVASGAVAEVGRRLDALDGWKRESRGEPHWVWFSGRRSQRATVRGMAHLEEGVLVVETNSRARMEQALGELHAALGSLVTASPTIYEDPIRAAQEQAARPRSGSELAEPAPSPETAAAMAELVRRAKDAHYRRTLGEPVPMLGNKTPRQCRRSKQGRALLVNWLKELENNELRHAAENGTAPYDMRWMWQELGVEGEP